jgi:gliding motility-associated lipoprotein GldH
LSCTVRPIFEQKIDINAPFVWHKDSIYHLNWENTDTSTLRDLFFTVRNNTDYPYYNLYLFFTTIAPDGAAKTDTLLFYLQNPETGEYYGRGYTGILDNKILFQEKKMSQIGIYQYSLQHGMRDSLLSGILDLGLRIENIKVVK